MQSCLVQTIKGSPGAEQIPEPAKQKEKFFSRLSELERTLNTLNLLTGHNSFSNRFSQCRVSFPMNVADLD